MKKILVPTDFSACANAAAITAIKVAQKIKAEVFYLNLCKEPVLVNHIPGTNYELPSEELKHAKSELSQLVSMTELQGVKASQVLVFDNGVDTIEDYVEPYGIDLIIMGSHGASGIKELVLGSNTQRIVNHVHVPVLVVKNNFELVAPKSILFVSDFSTNPLKEFEIVAILAQTYQSTVNIIFVNYLDNLAPAEVAQTKMNQLTAYYPEISFTYNVAETNDEEYAVAQFASQLNADLIAIAISENNSYLKSTSLRSAEHIVNHEKRPVLVLKN